MERLIAKKREDKEKKIRKKDIRRLRPQKKSKISDVSVTTLANER